ncbi:MAG: type II CAAX endopeptidase family protein [Pseudolysinimonas sp.]
MSEAVGPGADAVSPPPLRYPRLLRSLPGYRWWKPLIALLIAAVLWIVFQVVVGVGVFALAILVGDVHLPEYNGGDLGAFTSQVMDVVVAFFSLNAADAYSLVAGLGGVATLLPAVLLGYRIARLRPLSVLRSVMFCFRWRWFLLALAPALLITGVATVVGFTVLPAIGIGSAPVAPTTPLSTWLLCAAVILILTPIQAAAEEFAFRGLVMQAVGGWVRPAIVAVLVSTAVFAALHTQYLGWATADVAFFGLVAAYVTWRTGGLEASVALHAVNNTVIFLVLASGAAGSTTAVDLDHPATGDPVSLSVTIVTMGLYAVIVTVVARRRGLRDQLTVDSTPHAPAGIADTSSG